MKKVILSLAILFVSFATFAQTVAHDTVEYICIPKDGADHHLYDSIYNNTNSTVTVTWSVQNENFLTGWSYKSVCDPHLCYNNPITGIKTFTIPANSTAVIQATVSVLASGVDGSSYLTLNTSAGSMTYKYSTCPTTTKDFDANNFVNIYPNPANNFINIAINDKSVASVNVMNVIGRKIAKFDVDASRSPIRVPLDNVSNGVYLLQFADSKGKLLGVKKVTKQ